MDFHGNSVHQVGLRASARRRGGEGRLDTLPFSPRRYTNEYAVELAAKLAELAPGRLGKVLFAPGGTEAIGMALKLARVATGRHKTVSMWDSFHGASLDAISVGGEALFRRGVGPLLPGAEHVPPCDPRALPLRLRRECDARCAEYVDYVLEKEEDVAAVIVETVRSTDVQVPPPSLLRDLAPRVRPARRAADPRRDPDLPRPHRHDVRLRALRRRSRYGRARQGAGRRRLSDGRADRTRGPRRRGRPRARPLHAREELGGLRGGARDHRGDRDPKGCSSARIGSGAGARSAACDAGAPSRDRRGARSRACCWRSSSRDAGVAEATLLSLSRDGLSSRWGRGTSSCLRRRW